MAFISQEEKKKLAPQIKSTLKKYGMRGSISINHYSTLVVTIKSGKLDVMENFWENLDKRPSQWRGADYHKKPDNMEVYGVHGSENRFTGKVKEFFSELLAAMRGPDYFDHSDAMTDYFHCSHYYTIYVGKWNKPYICEK